MTKMIRYFAVVIAMVFLSTVLVNMSVFFYVVAHDEAFYRLYNISEGIKDDGLMSEMWLDGIERTIEKSDFFVSAIDFIWLASFINLIAAVWVGSYKMKREGYFSLLGLMTLGVMAGMFVLSVFIELSEWFTEIIINKVLLGYTFATPFYNFYIENAGVVSMVIIFVAIILNFVDFDFSKFNTRKEKELKEIN